MRVSELKKVLRTKGCKILREGSNHEIWISPEGRKFQVPRHNTQEVPTGTLKAILKQAGIE